MRTPLEAIIIYSDSTAFPRETLVSPSKAWPILLSPESNSVYLRGKGGIQAKGLLKMLREDSYYFGFRTSTNQYHLVIFAFGIVDCAPQPITYKLKIISRIPKLGPRLWGTIAKYLLPHRVKIQENLSFRFTSPSKFQKHLEKMIRTVTNKNTKIIVLQTPMPGQQALIRSPGLVESVRRYNQIKRQVSSIFPNVIFVEVEVDANLGYVSQEDGIHFSDFGHSQVASAIVGSIPDFT